MPTHRSNVYRTKFKVSAVLHTNLHSCVLTRSEAMYAEKKDLEDKNSNLVEAFREKNKAQQRALRDYQSLKAKVMATTVANAAVDEADLTLHTVRGDRYVDRLPGARIGTAHLSQLGANQSHSSGRHHHRGHSGSSGSNDHQNQRGGIGIAPQWSPQLQGRGLGRVHTGSKSQLVALFYFGHLSFLIGLLTFRETQLLLECHKNIVVGCRSWIVCARTLSSMSTPVLLTRLRQ
jgi:hypothetical protein